MRHALVPLEFAGNRRVLLRVNTTRPAAMLRRSSDHLEGVVTNVLNRRLHIDASFIRRTGALIGARVTYPRPEGVASTLE